MKIKSIRFHLTAVIATVALFTATPASAAISFLFTAGNLRDSDGSSLLPEGTLGLLVASTTGQPLDPALNPLLPGSINTGDTLGNPGNIIIWRGEINAGDGVLFDGSGNLNFGDFSGWGEGDALALYWFEPLTLAATAIQAGDSYGVYWGQGDNSGFGAGQDWQTPADSTLNYELEFVTDDFGPTTNPAALGFASYSVIPEPGTAVLVGMGLLLATMRRRFGRG